MFKNKILKVLTASLFLLPLSTSLLAADQKWQANVPGVARESADWIQLLDELQEKGMYAGALAAASRCLMFYTDLETKELAYKAILNVVDKGYPFPIMSYFQTGDLSPSGEYEFVNSYNLYKNILNREKGMTKWAKNYLEGIDTKNYRKYLFLEAIEAYGKRDYATSIQKLKDILSKESVADYPSFVRKVSRTLARAYFDQEQYAKSLDIYSTFLLKLSPVDPRDWLEAAWNLYYLKKYPEALGMLYNLESKASDKFVSLEKYTLRALIYRNQCAVGPAELLVQSFQKEFGEIITGLKRGKPLSKYSARLAAIEIPANSDFQQLSTTLDWLNQEQNHLLKLPKKVRTLAGYLYATETLMLNRKVKLYQNAALDRAALKLIMMDENLRFLKFSVQREKYNPDTVFKVEEETDEKESVDETGKTIKIRWIQNGDYWRDERLKFIGAIPNRCFD